LLTLVSQAALVDVHFGKRPFHSDPDVQVGVDFMPVTSRKRHLTLNLLSVSILLLLAFQFLVGMVVNLWYEIPRVHPGANAVEYFGGVIQVIWWGLTRSVWSLQAHIATGLILVLASSTLLAFAISSKRAGWIVTALCGWAGTVGAAFNGASFVIYGHEFSSFLMGIGFLITGISNSIGLFVQRARGTFTEEKQRERSGALDALVNDKST
jgi:hypothetical protein